MLSSKLLIKEFILYIKLGVSAVERKTPQKVEINLTIKFPTLPKACVTDDINDTICYHKLTDAIHEYCQSREFNLIEHLGHQIYQLIKAKIPKNHQIELQVAKQPPLPNIQETAFIIGD